MSAAAELILPEGTPRPDWLRGRRAGIGGSDIAGILGLSRWSSPYQVWLEKTGRSNGADDNPAMRWGRAVEPVMRQWFTEDTGIPVTTTGTWQSREHPLALANPDGLTGDGGGLEIKAHGWRMAADWADDQIADAAELQSQWYAGVLGRPHWWVIAKIGDDEPRIERVPADPDLFGNLLVAAERFWHDHVVADVAPGLVARDLDSVKDVYRHVNHPTVEAADPELVRRLLDRRVSGAVAAKQLLEDVDQAEAELRLLLGDAEVMTIGGVPVFSAKANGGFAPARFTEAHPDVAAEFTTTRAVLDVDRLKAERPDLYAAFRARVFRTPPKPKPGTTTTKEQ